MNERTPGFATLAIHAGAQPDPATGARATPIYQTTSYVFESVDHAASLFGLQTFGNIYTRIGNPTTAVLEERVAALEGGTAGLAAASGHAAQILIFHCLLQPGDEFVASRKLYGGSINQFNHAFKNFGWNVVWADPDDMPSFERAISPKTKAIFTESIANPGGVITDMAAVAQIAKRAGVPYIVDNTLATPYLCKPFDHGADIIVHSLTKFLGGHGNSIGGMVVDGAPSTGRARSAIRCCRSRGRNITASCCTRRSAILPSPSPAGCWRCVTSGRRSRRSIRSLSSPASKRCRCACSSIATTLRPSRNGFRRIRKSRG
jgi:O-acetylhomoserine (thiol)-lyase